MTGTETAAGTRRPGSFPVFFTPERWTTARWEYIGQASSAEEALDLSARLAGKAFTVDVAFKTLNVEGARCKAWACTRHPKAPSVISRTPEPAPPAEAQRRELPPEPVDEGFTTTEVCQEIGITYRQADYLVRSGIVPGRVGQGYQRRWPSEQVARLKLAAHISDIFNLSFIHAAELVIHGPPPPEPPCWAVVGRRSVSYLPSLSEVTADVVGPGVIVAPVTTDTEE